MNSLHLRIHVEVDPCTGNICQHSQDLFFISLEKQVARRGPINSIGCVTRSLASFTTVFLSSRHTLNLPTSA